MKAHFRRDFDHFLEDRVTDWQEHVYTCSLPTFLGMSDQEYGDWFLHRLGDQGYERLNRVWSFVQ